MCDSSCRCSCLRGAAGCDSDFDKRSSLPPSQSGALPGRGAIPGGGVLQQGRSVWHPCHKMRHPGHQRVIFDPHPTPTHTQTPRPHTHTHTHSRASLVTTAICAAPPPLSQQVRSSKAPHTQHKHFSSDPCRQESRTIAWSATRIGHLWSSGYDVSLTR